MLPRRGYVGLQVAPVADTGPAGPGLFVRSVAKGSSAERAGARAGDRLVAIGEATVSDMNTARRLLRGLRANDELRIGVQRDGGRLDLVDRVRAYPTEQHASGQIQLEQVQVGEHRLRAVALVPDSPGPHPVVYYLPGAHWASEEYPFAPEHPVPSLLGELAARGIASVRVDRFGMGDSEGPPCNAVDFDTEYQGYKAGVELLSRANWCIPERVVFIGHSLGAMVSPLLAVDEACPLKPRGILTYGASALPISAGLEGALQRYAKVQPDVPAAVIERQCELIRLIVTGRRTPAEAFRERPDLLDVRPEHYTDDTIYRRTVRFYHQLESQPLGYAWRNVDCPVLAVHGEKDWICGPDDSRVIATLNKRGEFRSAQAADHQLAFVAGDRLLPERPLTLAPSLRQLVTEWVSALLASG
jgi:hypothetical protein